MFKSSLFALSVVAASARAGTVLWSGIFNSTTTVADFDKWSWSNQIQPWQWYIHGSGATSKYLGLSSSFKNPADTTSAQGLRTTIDGTAFWNGQTMERTEIIPQTSANLGSGHLYYHFSISTSSTNPPSAVNEHQIAFFESHFTELKYGTLSGASGADNTLRWMIGGVTKWSTQLSPGTWYNFAYDIDFSSSTVGLWASTGSAALTQVVANQGASTSTNSADFHIGVLRLPNGGTSTAAEDFFWSGIYVESGPITTSVAGPKPGGGGTTTKPGTTTQPPSTTARPPTTTTRPPTTTTQPTSAPATTTQSGTVAHYGQCGGTGYNGPTTCQSPYTCNAVSPPYYYQCL